MEILPAHHYQFSGLLTSIASLSLVILVYQKAVDPYLKRRFVLYYLSLFIWSLSLFICTSVYDYQIAYFFTQMTHAGAILIPVFFLHFTFAYLNYMSRVQRILLWVLYVIAGFFMIINLFFRDYFFGNVVPKLSFPYFPNAGPFYTPWVVTFALAVIIAHIALLRAMMKAFGLRKNQIRFFLLANALGYFGGIGCFLPVYDLPYFPFPYGPYGVLLLSFVSGYAILRYRFIDLQLFLKKTIVFAALFTFIIGTFSFMLFIFQNILSSYININPFLIAAISAVAIIVFYDPFRRLLTNLTDKYLFQKRKEIKVILKGLAEKVGTVAELKQVGGMILSTLVDAFRLESGTIVVYDWKDQRYRLLENSGGAQEEFVQSVRRYIDQSDIQEYFKEHQSIVSLDEPASERLPEYVLEWMNAAGGRVCIPLFIDDDQNGFLILGKKISDQEFTAEEMDYFPTIESQASLVIQKARLLETIVEEREAKVKAEQLAKRVQFAGLIKHEIKNKLVHIEGPANEVSTYFVPRLKKLFKEQDEEFFLEFCDKIQENSKKINAAVRKILIIAQTASGGTDEKDKTSQELDCKVIWDDAKRESGLLEQCDFESKMPDGFSVYGNYHALQRVFVNLITNAYDAMRDMNEPLIKLRCSYEDIENKRVAYFEFEDSGSGIPKEIQEKIFEDGFSTKPKPGAKDLISSGHGQGLAACKMYIESIHTGKIWVESEVEKGTIFKFWVPIREDNGNNHEHKKNTGI